MKEIDQLPISNERDQDLLNKFDLEKGKEDLRTEGYTIARGLLTDDLTRQLFDEVIHIINKTQPPYSNLMQTSQYLSGSKLDRLINSAELLALSEGLCGGPCLRFLPFTAVKSPGGGHFQFHQDDQYRRFDAYGINFWFALNETTEQNGCLWIVPESHKMGPIPWVPTGDENRSRTMEKVPDGAIPVPMQPGDCLIFDRLTVHASGPNETEDYRVGYSITYSLENTKFLDTDGWKPLKEQGRWKTPPTDNLRLLSELDRGGHR